MPTYKLTFYNIPATAEVSRMLFFLAGVEFEDNRLEFNSKEWKELKPKTPFGEIPVLEIDGDGFLYAQSNAIQRYIAKKYGFAGKTELEQLRVDMIIDYIDDLLRPFTAIIMAKTEEEKASIRKKWVEEQAPPMLEKLEAIVKQNKGGDGWLVGDDITMADLHLQNWLDFPTHLFQAPPYLSKYPKLEALKKRVENHPKIAEWIANRPKSMV